MELRIGKSFFHIFTSFYASDVGPSYCLSAFKISRGHFFAAGYPLIDFIGIPECDNSMNLLFCGNPDSPLYRRISLHCINGKSDETGAEMQGDLLSPPLPADSLTQVLRKEDKVFEYLWRTL